MNMHIPTPCNWAGTFDDGTAEVRVSLRGTVVNAGASGTDDFYVGAHLVCASVEEAQAVYEREVRWYSNLAFITPHMVAERYVHFGTNNNNGFSLRFKPSLLRSTDQWDQPDIKGFS